MFPVWRELPFREVMFQKCVCSADDRADTHHVAAPVMCGEFKLMDSFLSLELVVLQTDVVVTSCCFVMQA